MSKEKRNELEFLALAGAIAGDRTVMSCKEAEETLEEYLKDFLIPSSVFLLNNDRILSGLSFCYICLFVKMEKRGKASEAAWDLSKRFPNIKSVINAALTKFDNEEYPKYMREMEDQYQACFFELESKVKKFLAERSLFCKTINAIRKSIKIRTEELENEIIRIEKEEWENGGGDNLKRRERKIWEEIRLSQESTIIQFPYFRKECPHSMYARWGGTEPGDRQECLICGEVFEVSDGGCD